MAGLPFGPRQTPVTLLILISIAIVFALETSAGGSTNSDVLIAFGANHPVAVIEYGQWWRLFTSMFVHIGFAHVLLNGWALFQLGSLFELAIGSGSMLVVYVLTGLAGSAASLWWTQGLSAGASGAIFGLLGALISFLLRRRDALTPFARSLLSQLVLWAGINVVFGFIMPGIDNAAHLGGCAMGLVLGLLLRGRQPHRRERPAEVPV